MPGQGHGGSLQTGAGPELRAAVLQSVYSEGRPVCHGERSGTSTSTWTQLATSCSADLLLVLVAASVPGVRGWAAITLQYLVLVLGGPGPPSALLRYAWSQGGWGELVRGW